MYWITCIILLAASTANCLEKRFEVTQIHIGKTNNELLEKITNLVDHGYQRKVEAEFSKVTGILSLFTEYQEYRKDVLHTIREWKRVDEKHIVTKRLPDVKIKDSYHRSKRSLQDFDINAFNTFDSVNDYLDDFTKANFPYVDLHIIGSTYHQRPLKLIKISANMTASKPKIFMDGGQHAREWISPAVILYTMHEILDAIKNPGHNLSTIANAYEFHLIPILNPDGYIYTYAEDGERFWRKNRKTNLKAECSGVDLNRNFDFHFAEAGSSSDECSPVYRGSSANSELETQAIVNYILNQTSWHSFFTLHSYGQMILFPYSHTNVFSPDFHRHWSAGKAFAEGIKEINGRHYLTGALGVVLYQASGSSESWAYAVAGFPYAYSIELPSTSSFILPTYEIQPISKEWLNGLKKYLEHIETTEPNLYDEIIEQGNWFSIEELTVLPPSNSTDELDYSEPNEQTKEEEISNKNTSPKEKKQTSVVKLSSQTTSSYNKENTVTSESHLIVSMNVSPYLAPAQSLLLHCASIAIYISMIVIS